MTLWPIFIRLFWIVFSIAIATYQVLLTNSSSLQQSFATTIGRPTFHEPCSKMWKLRQSLLDYILVLMDPGIVFGSLWVALKWFLDPQINQYNPVRWKDLNLEANSKQFTDHVSIFFQYTLLACWKQNKKLNISKSI